MEEENRGPLVLDVGLKRALQTFKGLNVWNCHPHDFLAHTQTTVLKLDQTIHSVITHFIEGLFIQDLSSSIFRHFKTMRVFVFHSASVGRFIDQEVELGPCANLHKQDVFLTERKWK